jgi:hypothetical protein
MPENSDTKGTSGRIEVYRHGADKTMSRRAVLNRDVGKIVSAPWALEMNAISIEEPSRLVQTLVGGVLGCGGWVLSHVVNDGGRVNMLFEFERGACVDIYSVLVAAGVELGQHGHNRLTELCQCTLGRRHGSATEIASIDLELQTYPMLMTNVAQPSPTV